MRLMSTWMIAVKALRRNMMRSMLTMLGIIIGVAAVIAMVAIGSGAREQVATQIGSMGQNMLMVMSGAARSGRVHMGFGSAPTLTKGDYAAIRQEISGITGATPEVRGSAQVTVGNQNVSTMVYGVSEDYVPVRSWKVEAGQNLTDTDVSRSAKVVVLGRTVAKNLFGDGDAVGQVVRIANAPDEVVGVLKPKGANMMGDDQDDMVLVPWSSAMVRLTGGTSFRSITVQAESADRLEDVMEQLTALLRQRHRIREGQDDDFHIRNQQDMLEMATSTAETMTVLLGAIAGVSLLVGGIGIMNIMLVTVTERTREIGLKKAIGAKKNRILRQFLTEAAVLTSLGGVIGVITGIILAKVLSLLMQTPSAVSVPAIIVAVAFSTVIGVVFGLIPAVKAANLNPIDALRRE